MAISIDYNLIGRGWSECIIEIDDQHVRLTACYLSDALADLLNAVTIILQGTEEATASFTEEPGEYRWQLKRVAPDRLCINIVWFRGIEKSGLTMSSLSACKQNCKTLSAETVFEIC